LRSVACSLLQPRRLSMPPAVHSEEFSGRLSPTRARWERFLPTPRRTSPPCTRTGHDLHSPLTSLCTGTYLSRLPPLLHKPSSTPRPLPASFCVYTHAQFLLSQCTGSDYSPPSCLCTGNDHSPPSNLCTPPSSL
jgi:hypothetical protein